MRKYILISIMSIVVAGLGFGQDQGTAQTGQSGQSSTGTPDVANQPAAPDAPLYTMPDQQQPTSSSTVLPDDRPLTGVHELTLGTLESGTNVLIPSLSVSQTAQTNPYLTSGGGNGFQGSTYLNGALELEKTWNQNVLTLRYNGSGQFLEGPKTSFEPRDTTYQMFGIGQSLSFGRWNVYAGDEVNYSPEAMFGCGGFGSISGGIDLPPTGLSGLGTCSLLGLQAGVQPSQTILTTTTSRLSNTVIGQAQYNLTRWTSITVSGNYGLLHFPDESLYDSTDEEATLGLNHRLGARDTIALGYTFSNVAFSSSPITFLTHGIFISYAHQLTGRLSFTAAGGPQLLQYNDPVSPFRRWSGSGNGSLHYLIGRKYDWSITYSRTANAGSGVLLGAETDAVMAGLAVPLGRAWNASFDGGYSRNSGLQQNRGFNGVIAGASVHRRLGRYTGVFFSYGYQHQTSSNCGTVCSFSFDRQQFGFGFDWQYHPISLD